MPHIDPADTEPATEAVYRLGKGFQYHIHIQIRSPLQKHFQVIIEFQSLWMSRVKIKIQIDLYWDKDPTVADLYPIGQVSPSLRPAPLPDL